MTITAQLSRIRDHFSLRQKRLLFLFIPMACTGIMVVTSIMLIAGIPGLSDASEEKATGNETVSNQNNEKSIVNLYFSNKENTLLKAEKRVLFHPSDPAEFGLQIMQSLIDGSRKGLVRTLPAETKVRALFVTDDGIAYVDISEDITWNHSGGSKSELLTIYSITNSLTLNISEISSVVILINGKEAMTLAGHIDLRFPFITNLLLIK